MINIYTGIFIIFLTLCGLAKVTHHDGVIKCQFVIGEYSQGDCIPNWFFLYSVPHAVKAFFTFF